MKKILALGILVGLFTGCGTVMTSRKTDVRVISDEKVIVKNASGDVLSKGKFNSVLVSNRAWKDNYLLVSPVSNETIEKKVEINKIFSTYTLGNIATAGFGLIIDVPTGAFKRVNPLTKDYYVEFEN